MNEAWHNEDERSNRRVGCLLVGAHRGFDGLRNDRAGLLSEPGDRLPEGTGRISALKYSQDKFEQEKKNAYNRNILKLPWNRSDRVNNV